VAGLPWEAQKRETASSIPMASATGVRICRAGVCGPEWPHIEGVPWTRVRRVASFRRAVLCSSMQLRIAWHFPRKSGAFQATGNYLLPVARKFN